MTTSAWITIFTILGIIAALIKNVERPDFIFLTGLILLLATGVLSPSEAFSGFANQAVFTVGALFVVAAGVQRTRALAFLDHMIFQEKAGIRSVMFRMIGSTSFFSAFLNNTPIVAMFIPQVQEWSERTGIPASRLLIPLSYAAIVGGLVTLIGTSTNLIISGLIVDRGYAPLGFFELSWIGIPAALMVLIYFSTVGYRMLPERVSHNKGSMTNGNKYQFDLKIPKGSILASHSVDHAGMRALEKLFLIHVHRKGHIIGPVGPEFVLEEEDVLTFMGDVQSVDNFAMRKKLERTVPVLDKDEKSLPMFEAVVAPTSSMIGKSLKEVAFRNKFGGVVVGIQRRDENILGFLGNVPIKAGDLLLIEAKTGFDQEWNRINSEFYLVSSKGKRNFPISEKAPLVLGIVVIMVGLVTLNAVSMITAAMLAALAMVLTGCVKRNEVLEAVNLPILLVIAAAIGVGQALEVTGLAQTGGNLILNETAGFGLIAVIAGIYLLTNLLTEFITNNAAAVLMLPLALAVGIEAGLDGHAVAVIVAVASSASFLTPIGYQTNLMVLGAGHYKFTDYFKAGLPLTIILMVITILMVKLVWL